MYRCQFCGYESDDLEDFEEDFTQHKGFFCPYCDGFTYFETVSARHNFSVIYETSCDQPQMVSKKAPSFKTQVSPLRWPGGKSKIVQQILERCHPEHMECFIEPYAGGASVGLSLLLTGKVKELYLNDLDYGVFSLFQMIKTMPYILMDKIDAFVPTKEEFYEAKSIVESGYEGCDMTDAAWNLLVANRLAFSGIVKGGCLSKPESRWNARTLKNRIMAINEFATHVHVSCMDACKYIEEMYWVPNATMFIDPPYKMKGKALYEFTYADDDHERLAFLLDELYKGVPGADMLVTYDFCDFTKQLFQFPKEELLDRKYSCGSG